MYESKHLTIHLDVLVSQIFGKLIENVGVTFIWQEAVAASNMIAIGLEWRYLICQTSKICQPAKLKSLSTKPRIQYLPIIYNWY